MTHQRSWNIPRSISLLVFGLFGLVVLHRADGQVPVDSNLIQFSGIVYTDEGDTIIPLPFVNIAIKGTTRGTYTDLDGFFSIVVKEGDTVQYSAIGFQTVTYVIPDTLKTDRYTVFQYLPKDTIWLPETVVYPWPSREHFRVEFLALDVESDYRKMIRENLSDMKLSRYVKELPSDSKEMIEIAFKQYQKKLYYAGQLPPMINVMALYRFLKEWTKGKLKRKR